MKHSLIKQLIKTETWRDWKLIVRGAYTGFTYTIISPHWRKLINDYSVPNYIEDYVDAVVFFRSNKNEFNVDFTNYDYD